MTQAAAYRSGKTYRAENFPVASRLLGSDYRRPVMAFYEFVRSADDVADHPDLPPSRKFALLDELEATLIGKSNSQPEAIALREVLAERGLGCHHAREMLTAFRRDVTRRRYRNWDGLVEYCRYSAMPVGRFVLDLCGESRSTWPASDALCTALQVINHLQDCGDDYRKLGRVYLPVDMLSAHGTRIEALSLTTAGEGLRRCLGDVCDRVAELLAVSDGLAGQVSSSRLALEIAVIQRLAVRLVYLLRNGDPLSERVQLSTVGSAGFAMLGLVRGGTRRFAGIPLSLRSGAGSAETAPGPTEQIGAAEVASGSSFYAAMRILPARRREAIFEIYAFCRAVDDIADGGGDKDRCVEQLDEWRCRVDSLYGGRPMDGCAGLARATAEFGLQREDFLAVIDGMEMDVIWDMRAPPAATLDLYCDRVASAVGRLCVRIFGMNEDEGKRLAHHLGRALQLTNILRDLDEDAEMGRLYLPREPLAEAGINVRDPDAVLAHPALDSVCRRIAGSAFVHFVEADAVMAAAPRSTVRAPRIMANAYRAILDGLVQRGWRSPRERIRLNRAQLARIALRSLVL